MGSGQFDTLFHFIYHMMISSVRCSNSIYKVTYNMTEYNLTLVKLERECSTQFSLPLLVLILTVADEYPVRMFSDPLLVHSSDVQQFHDMNDTICIFHPVVVYEYPVQTESHTANGCGNFRIHLFSAVIQGTLKKF